MMKEYRTSIVFSNEMRKRIRQRQAQTNESMKTIIVNALEKYLAEKPERAYEEVHRSERKFADKILHEIRQYLAPDTAYLILDGSCRKIGITVDSLTVGDVSPELIYDICRKIGMLKSDVDADRVRKRLESIVSSENMRGDGTVNIYD